MCRLLVVSDVQHERRLIAEQALSVCDTVEEVLDSEAAAEVLNRAARHPPIVITALAPDGMAFVDTLQRQSNGAPSIPIVLIVEPGRAAVARQATGAGVRLVVQRPLNGTALHHALQEIIEGVRDDVQMETGP